MSRSTLTSKFQVTIPKNIRTLLQLKVGDFLIFEITKDQKVFVKKGTSEDIVDLGALESILSEWNSTYDDEVCGDL